MASPIEPALTLAPEDIISLTHLQTNAGWQVLVRLIENDLAELRKELEDPETPAARDQEIKLQIAYMKELIGMPQKYIDENSPDSESEGDDPFENQEQLTERRNNPTTDPTA